MLAGSLRTGKQYHQGRNNSKPLVDASYSLTGTTYDAAEKGGAPLMQWRGWPAGKDKNGKVLGMSKGMWPTNTQTNIVYIRCNRKTDKHVGAQ